MKKNIQLKLLTLLLFGVVTTSCSQTNQSIETIKGNKITNKDLNFSIEKVMESLQMPGLSIAIINNNEVVYHNVFGVANNVTNAKINKQSIFEGASLSKPLFAYFAMKMVDKGILDLDKPLYQYIPHPGIAEESKDLYQLITPRMVLSHSTGFPNFSNNKNITIPFKPGTDFSYSGEAYQYLTAIIGHLNNVGWKDKFNTIFEAEVNKPLNMKHTSFLWNDHLAANKVYGHDEKNNTPTDNNTGEWSGKTFNSFSSVHSEALDYSKFIVAMLKRKGLTKNSFDEMLSLQNKFKPTNKMLKETGQIGWGLGFAQKKTPYGIMHLHTGNNHDFQSYTMFIPQKKYGIIAFTNSGKMLLFLKELEQILGAQF